MGSKLSLGPPHGFAYAYAYAYYKLIGSVLFSDNYYLI
jgi:hypothetical protein